MLCIKGERMNQKKNTLCDANEEEWKILETKTSLIKTNVWEKEKKTHTQEIVRELSSSVGGKSKLSWCTKNYVKKNSLKLIKLENKTQIIET